MSEMVERVRNAIDEALKEAGVTFPYHPRGLDPVARAAIEAMREPTKAMLDAAWRMSGESQEMRPRTHAHYGRHYRAMITQALQENPDNG